MPELKTTLIVKKQKKRNFKNLKRNLSKNDIQLFMYRQIGD